MLLVITGTPCAGKTTAMEVCKKMGAKSISSGDVVRQEIEKRGYPYTEDTDRLVSGWFHTKGREKLIVGRSLAKLGRFTSKDFVVVEGLRSVVQVKELERATKTKPVVVALTASFKDRWVRCHRRGRFQKETKDYIKQRDKTEIKRGLGKLIRSADYVFDTTGMDARAFGKEFEKFVRRLNG